MKKSMIILFGLLLGISGGMCQDTTYVNIGEEFTATIRMELQGEISGVRFDIVFDPTALEYISYDFNNIFDMEMCNTTMPGRLPIGLVQQGNGNYISNSTRNLISIKFKLLKSLAEIKFANGEILKDSGDPGYTRTWEGGVVRSEQIPGGSVLFKVIISR